MPLAITYTFSDGTTIVAGQANTNFTDVKTFVDALQAGTGFTALAIGSASIAAGAITATKLAATAVTAGTYTAPVLTVDAQGRLTASANGYESDQVIISGQVFG